MGAIQFQCPQCGATLKTDESGAGQQVRCPKCSTTFTIPPASAAPRPAPAHPGEQYKKCPFCAEEILAGAMKCKHCGSMVGGPAGVSGTAPAGQSRRHAKVNGMAVASLVLGLIPCTCVPSLMAIIFGHIALGQIANAPDRYKGRGMAMWGTGLGYFFTACNLIYGIICGINAA